MKGLIVGKGKGTYSGTDLNQDNIFVFGGNSIGEETDPTVPSYVKNISQTQINNWDLAYGWGDHSIEGYLKPIDLNGYATENFVTSQGYITSVSWNDILDKPSLDDYSAWNLGANGSYTSIGSGESVNFVATGISNTTRAGNTITIDTQDYRKEILVISASTYTISYSDLSKWLKFTATNCTVTIPQDVLSTFSRPVKEGELEGQFDGSGTLTFTAGAGMTLKKPSSLSASIPQYGVFGIKWDDLASATLFGTLNPV